MSAITFRMQRCGKPVVARLDRPPGAVTVFHPMRRDNFVVISQKESGLMIQNNAMTQADSGVNALAKILAVTE